MDLENEFFDSKNISYILQFIDRARFVGSSLSNLGNNVSEEIHEIKCKYRHDNKKCENYGIKFKIWDCFLRYTNFKDDLIECKCLCYNESLMKNWRNHFLIDKNFVTATIISLFYCCKKVLILMNIWMIGKNSMKHH